MTFAGSYFEATRRESCRPINHPAVRVLVMCGPVPSSVRTDRVGRGAQLDCFVRVQRADCDRRLVDRVHNWLDGFPKRATAATRSARPPRAASAGPRPKVPRRVLQSR
jgi:hypothetical protein